MQVDSVSSRFSPVNTAFKSTIEERSFASLGSSDLRKIAFAKASNDVNDKKHRIIDNALLYSLPIAGGISAVSRKLSPEAVAKIGKQNIRAFKLGNFGLVTAGWSAALMALDALWGVKDYLAKKVEFIKDNPLISNIATFAAGLGVLEAVDKYGNIGLAKILDSLNKGKVLRNIGKVRTILNNSKILNRASEFMAKVPSPIKDFSRKVGRFAPLIVIATQIGHMFNHEAVKAKVTMKNYDKLNKSQQMIRQSIISENVNKKTISDLYDEYGQMLKTKPIIDAQTKNPITFEQFVKLATTYVK